MHQIIMGNYTAYIAIKNMGTDLGKEGGYIYFSQSISEKMCPKDY